MNRTIAVIRSFHTDAHLRQMEAVGQKYGFTFRYFPDDTQAMADIADCEVLYSHSDPSLLAAARNLRWFCCDFAGVDKYLSDDLYCRKDCLLSNSSGAYGTAIAEHLIMTALMLLRRMPEYQAAMARRCWAELSPIRSLYGLRITVLGTGDVGGSFARRVKAMGATVYGVNRSGQCSEPAFDRIFPISDLETVLPQTEMLVMCLPSTPETKGILSRSRIALLPEDAYVLNAGRGSALDQQALMEALNASRLAGAALDVMEPEPLPPEHPLWETKNLILTPHCSGDMALGYTCDRNVDMFCQDLENYALGRPLLHLVNRKRGY